MNHLYYGDNLEVIRRYIDDGSVDLVYLDPPFKSDQNYNVLFAEQDGTRSAAQIQVFEDTWRWDQAAAAAFQEIVEGGGQVSLAMQAFRHALGENDLLAYLSMMAPRLMELRRVMKASGGIYLHCDPTAGHYLKVLMDSVFGASNFRNEIVWKRTHAHGGARRYGPVHDLILFYSRSDDYKWIGAYTPYSADYIESFFKFADDDGRRFRSTILTGTGTRNGSSGQPWRGIDPTAAGRHWAIPGYVRHLFPDQDTDTAQEALDQLESIGRILWPKKAGGTPSFKQYLNDMPGVPVQDVWTDILPLSSQAAERLGYPTQKPEALLERIITASSDPHDLVLDPFCGCGTAVAVAQQMGRRWIGIDVTHLAITLIKHRLATGFTTPAKYAVTGEPVDIGSAAALAESDPYQFQWWALGLVGARPVEQKKGADKGIDGRLFFHDEDVKGQTKQIIFSVKAGKTSAPHVRDLVGVVEREKAAIGVLITMETPTKPMRTEAASGGFYKSPWDQKDYPKIQLLTVEDLLEGRAINMPATRDIRTFKAAPKAKRKANSKQKKLDMD